MCRRQWLHLQSNGLLFLLNRCVNSHVIVVCFWLKNCYASPDVLFFLAASPSPAGNSNDQCGLLTPGSSPDGSVCCGSSAGSSRTNQICDLRFFTCILCKSILLYLVAGGRGARCSCRWARSSMQLLVATQLASALSPFLSSESLVAILRS